MRNLYLTSLILLCLTFSAIAQAGQYETQLTWDPNSELDLAGYNIYRATIAGGPYSKVNGSLIKCGPGDSSCCLFTDPSPIFGIDYFYVATAVNTSGLESGYSNEVHELELNPNAPAPPTGLQKQVQGASVQLDWNEYPGAERYVIYTSVDGSTWDAIAQTSDIHFEFKAPPGQGVQFAGIRAVTAGRLSDLAQVTLR